MPTEKPVPSGSSTTSAPRVPLNFPPLDDELKACSVSEQAGIEFCLDGAGGRGTGEAGQADFLRDAGMEFQHGSEVPVR